MSSSSELILSDALSSGAQDVVDEHGVTHRTFHNGRVLSLRSSSAVFLSDDGHRLKPCSFFTKFTDEEGRTSIKIGLRMGKMPASSGWGSLSDSIELRSYAAFRPWWRAHEYDDGSADRNARDKVVLHGNLAACVSPEDQKQFSVWSSSVFRNDPYGKDEISDELWSPCEEFAMAAVLAMKDGKFPDFSLLNANSGHTNVRFPPLDDVLAYDGPLKDCE